MGETDTMVEELRRASHHHEAAVPDHKHFHVTHYLHKGENWAHLCPHYVHEHNHPELEPCTSRTRTSRGTQARGHIHDHARPVDSPA